MRAFVRRFNIQSESTNRAADRMTLLTSDCDDYVLLSHAVEGDRYAFDKLAERYKPRLYAAAFRVTHNHEQACDAVTDALLRLYRTGGSFRFESKLSTWLHRVVVNCARDIARRTLNRPTKSLEAMLESQGEAELLSQDQLTPVIDREDLILEANERIIEELTHLPQADRDLLLAVHLNHTPYDDIALELHIPVGTVKSRIFRARRMLKDRLPSLNEIEEDCEAKHFAALVA